MANDLTRFFQKATTPAEFRRIILASVIAGTANAGVVVIINNASEDFSDFQWRYLAMFAITIILYITTRRFALQKSIVGVQRSLIDLNQRLADKTRHIGLRSYERIGPERIIADLTENSSLILEASRMATSAAAAVVMLFASFVYIAILSPAALWLSLFLVSCGIYAYLHNEKKISLGLRETRRVEQEYSQTLHHLTLGFTEVKMNRARSDSLFHQTLGDILTRLRDLKSDTEKRFVDNMIFTQIFFYLLIAAIIFLLPRFESQQPHIIVQLVTMILFIVGPLGAVVDAMPTFTKANIALSRLAELEAQLDEAREVEPTYSPLAHQPTFTTLSLQHMYFTYNGSEPSDHTFRLGPVNLDVRAGEILFIVGGNGSGKTTLLKLLTGLYTPQAGVLQIDGRPIAAGEYEQFRQLFSVIFTDFHLFDRLYGMNEVEPKRVWELLEQMDIAKKVRFDGDVFETPGLSTGQRKRLALVCALLEDRPILLFDEVAADQDPQFRRYYYEVFLPSLRQQGKTVIVVSHDDRYFGVADRVLKMDYGTLAVPPESVERNNI
ncbi:cyclic peptide export ABC transporter [Chrysiogenes arsenatis]|uniref:cyclic peptide export ABC transporter n=1 Tax=Chrysiogenes arsenatis TaxID=309797 RepID=UPI00041AD0F2|nr:cyclic peptide export ABC transporter [Chrysiogenes arsenatis]